MTKIIEGGGIMYDTTSARVRGSVVSAARFHRRCKAFDRGEGHKGRSQNADRARRGGRPALLYLREEYCCQSE